MKIIDRKYILHVSGSLFIGALIFYSYSCAPLPFDELTRIARSVTNDPACMVQYYNIEVPELPQNTDKPPVINYIFNNGTAASGVSNSTVPYTELTKII